MAAGWRSAELSEVAGEATPAPHEEIEAQIPMLFMFLSLLIGAAVRFILHAVHEKFHFRVPYTVVLLVIGGIYGGLAFQQWDRSDGLTTEEATVSLVTWSNIEPVLIFYVFLPALIMEAMMSTNFSAFIQSLPVSLLLAGPGMMLQVGLIALVCVYILPYGWGWTESIMFGGILSATDPVACIAVLKELGVLPDLRILIEAESVLNDGAAIVVFELCKAILIRSVTSQEGLHGEDGMEVEAHGVGSYVAEGCQLVFAAPALGCAFYFGMELWLSRTEDPIQDTIGTVVATYMAFYVSTKLGISGVLTIATIGVLWARRGHLLVSTAEAHHMVHSVWTVLVYCADTIIFIWGGAVIAEKIFSTGAIFTAQDWGWMFFLYFCITLFRAVMIFVCYPAIRSVAFGMQPRTLPWSKFLKNMFVLNWAGLRGAVGLVLALDVAASKGITDAVSDPHFGDRVVIHVCGLIVLTTLINAAFMEKVIQLLGLSSETPAEKKLFESVQHFLSKKHRGIMSRLQNQVENPELAGVDWKTVTKLVGNKALTKREEWEEDSTDIDNQSMADIEESETELRSELLGRFLTSLRASYTAQWHSGVIASEPYRKILWCLDQALDHSSDTVEVMNSSMKYEWGYLETEGYLEAPWWVELLIRYFGKVRFLHRLLRHTADSYTAERFEMVLAVIRAHEETARAEVSDMAAEGLMEICLESQAVQTLAGKMLVQMEEGHPAVACAVRTRQACCQLIQEFKGEIDALFHIAQITAAEHERLSKIVDRKSEHLTRGYPKVEYKHRSPETFPVLRHIPADKFHTLWEALGITPENVPEGQQIIRQGEAGDGVYIIAKGVVRWNTSAAAATGDLDAMAMSGGKGPAVVDDIELRMVATDESGPPSLLGGDYALIAGSSFGEMQFLLQHTGASSTNHGSAFALTNCTIYHITFDMLMKIVHECPVVLEKLWNTYGQLLLLSRPEHFSNLAAAPETFENARLKLGVQGVKVRRKHPMLLVRGSAMQLPTSRQPTGTPSSPVNPLTFIPAESRGAIVFTAESTLLVFAPEESTIIYRRSVEMYRGGIGGIGNRPIGGAGQSVNLARASMDIGRQKNSLTVERKSMGLEARGGGSMDLPGKRFSMEIPRGFGLTRSDDAPSSMNSRASIGGSPFLRHPSMDVTRVNAPGRLQMSLGMARKLVDEAMRTDSADKGLQLPEAAGPGALEAESPLRVPQVNDDTHEIFGGPKHLASPRIPFTPEHFPARPLPTSTHGTHDAAFDGGVGVA